MALPVRLAVSTTETMVHISAKDNREPQYPSLVATSPASDHYNDSHQNTEDSYRQEKDVDVKKVEPCVEYNNQPATSLVSLADNITSSQRMKSKSRRRSSATAIGDAISRSVVESNNRHVKSSLQQNNNWYGKITRRRSIDYCCQRRDSDSSSGSSSNRTMKSSNANKRNYYRNDKLLIKRVRFAPAGTKDEIISYVPNREDIADNAHADYWILRNELDAIRSTVVRLARESKLYYGNQLLDSTYISDLPAPDEGVGRQQQAASRITQAQVQLGLWCRHCDSRRGLECGMNYDHRIERRRLHKKTIKSILHAQHMMRNQHRTPPSSIQQQQQQQQQRPPMSQTEISSELAKLSMRLNQPARQFAEMMGRADEYAVQIELEDLLDDTSPESFKSRRPDVIKLNEMVLIKHSISNEDLQKKYPEATAA